jgi:hypothetical protein
VNRDIEFSEFSTVRIVFKRDLLEAYLNDYLVMLKRLNWSGKLGIIVQKNEISGFRAWVHD